ncbi:MAG: CHRD domain-containing protein [bacterium]|nr:CHRD domain-containing protein [bacterium]
MKKILLALSALAFFGVAQATQAAHYKQTFYTNLSGGEEVPPVTTEMTGDATFNVSNDEGFIDYTLNVENGKAVTAAHLHCAAPGQNGPVVVGLFSNPAGVDMDGQLAAGTLDVGDVMAAGASCDPNINTLPHLVQAMREGKIYVNVHTMAHPSGEVRGQLGHSMQPTAQSMLKHESNVMLSGSQEVPAVSTEATGKAHIGVQQDERMINYKIELTNAMDVTAAHLHCAPAGQNGPVVVGLFNNPAGVDVNGELASGMIPASDLLAGASACSPNITTMSHLVQAMREGKIYVNVHTMTHPNGELRGQVSF